MRALFFTVGRNTPAARYRVQQFFPHFEARGVQCELRTAYGDRYQAMSRSRLGPLYKLGGRIRRAARTIDVADYDIVFLQRTALNASALPERIASRRNPRIIYDVDDSVFLHPSGRASWRRKRAFDNAVRLSAHVICGNRHLAEVAGAPGKTSVIPTVVDTDVYRPASGDRRPGPTIIGWMGTASNFGSLALAVPALRAVLERYSDVRFRLVSNDTFGPLVGHPQVDQIRWSAERELEELRSFDIGIMPLPDNGLTRGKCGFKMILYMAVGCPVVSSAVGANVDIFEGSGAGRLPRHEGEWFDALMGLLADPDQRRVMGQAARRHAERHYSVSSVLDSYMEIFERVARYPAR